MTRRSKAAPKATAVKYGQLMVVGGIDTEHTYWTQEKLRRLCIPACKALPFVKLKENDQPQWQPESFWHTEPSGNYAADIRRGRQYANMAFAAMKQDCGANILFHVLSDIISDGIERRGMKGRKRYNPISVGFLRELGALVYEGVNGSVDPRTAAARIFEEQMSC